MHDVWPATALCHLTLGCEKFKSACQNCKYLPSGGGVNDLSAKVWRRKQKVLEGQNMTFVACSRWLEGEAKASALLQGQRIVSIPNPIDTHVFRPSDKQKAREKLGLPADRKLILFVSQRVTNVNKGMRYLVEACNQLVEEDPELKEKAGVLVLGGHAEEIAPLFKLPVFALDYVSEAHQIATIYSASDVFVLPSLSENLPNTIMESMACGVPCVGFEVGGIPEEIDHLANGYVAKYKDSGDLARGLHWVLSVADYPALSRSAVAKVLSCYSQDAVAMKYIDIYNKVLSETNPKKCSNSQS